MCDQFEHQVGISNFSEYKSEEEYILAPGTQFEVTNVTRKASKVEIHMKEPNLRSTLVMLLPHKF